jgi:hypothetical protein
VKAATNIVKAACCLHNFVMAHCISKSCQDNADGSPDEGTDESTPAFLLHQQIGEQLMLQLK